MRQSKHLLLAASLGFALPASAAVVITPTGITFTGTATEAGGINLDNELNLINGNGLSGTPTIGNITTITHSAASFAAPGNAWTTTDPGGFPSDFFASTSATIIFDLTLDNTYNITDLYTWGYHFGSLNGNDISALTIDYGVGNFTDGTLNVNVALATNPGDAVQTSLGTITANQLRLTVTDNHFGAATGGDRVSAAEFRFVGDVVPEPSSALLLGLGGLGLLRRRR